MQIETTITTTETQTVFGQDFLIKVVERSITAFCDCCDNQASGGRTNLEVQGWFLGSKSQFCPECNY